MYLFLFCAFLNCSCSQHRETENSQSTSIANRTSIDSIDFHSGITVIYQDKKGRYWMGSKTEGLALYQDSTFQYFKEFSGQAISEIVAIQEDDNQDIWIQSTEGFYIFDGADLHAKSSIKAFQPINWTPKEGDLWFGAGTKPGVFRVRKGQLVYLPFPTPLPNSQNYNVYSVTSIALGKNNRIWLGTYAGVLGFNDQEFDLINNQTLGLEGSKMSVHVRSVYEDSKERLWIGNNGIGLWVKYGDSIIDFSQKYHLVPENSERNGKYSPKQTLEHVFAIAQDNDDNLWFSDRDTGLWKFNGEVFENTPFTTSSQHEFIFKIYKDRIGKLWFLSSTGIVYEFTNGTFSKRF